jgi:hypothetical protein
MIKQGLSPFATIHSTKHILLVKTPRQWQQKASSRRDGIHIAPELNQADNKNLTTDQKARPFETAQGRYPKGKAII